MTAALTVRTGTGRWVILACVLGSGLAGIDATVVNIALPDIGRDLHVGFATLQWTITSYTVTLAALILLGGALGDRFGRRRIFVIGIVWFAVASLLCAAAQDATWLVGARALQGVGGALLTPASLAIIQASFADDDRTTAIGAWSGLSGAASAIAPFVGGWLLQAGSWRWVFLINPPLAIVVARIAARHIPETRDPDQHGRIDVAGAALGVVGLGGVTAGLIASSDHGFAATAVWLPLSFGVAGLGAFLAAEHRGRHPMMPLALFRSRQFSATNAVTFLLYAANSGALLLLVIGLETVSGVSPLRAGSALLPITVVMLFLAARFGALAQRIGPRVPMTVGPLVSAGGLALLSRLSTTSNYWLDILPAVTVFGLGLAVFVAPLTATVLGAVPASHAGVASGVNNAVARAAGLIAVAALPVVVGLTGHAYESASAYLTPFRHAIWICAGLHVGGAALAGLLIRDDAHTARRVAVPATSITLAGDPTLAGHANAPARRHRRHHERRPLRSPGH